MINTHIKCVLYGVASIVLTACATLREEAPTTQSQAGCKLTAEEIVKNFSDMFYRQKRVRPAFEEWVHPDYIQHKPTLPDGREAVVIFLEGLLARFPERTFTIHRIIASDDLVAVHYHSQANAEDLGFAVVDIFRVEDCKMVEHWDVVQPVPAESANSNTMF